MAKMKLKPDYYRTLFKNMDPRPGYGERRLKKLKQRYPLLDMMGELPTTEELDRNLAEANHNYGTNLRRQQAKRWIRLRRKIKELTPEQLERFKKSWDKCPHDPARGLDIIMQILK